MNFIVTREKARLPLTVFHLEGNLADERYDLLIDQAQQAIAGSAGYLLLDMAGVGHMSSAGIRAISQVFNWLRDLPGGEIDMFLEIQHVLAKAVASFQRLDR